MTKLLVFLSGFVLTTFVLIGTTSIVRRVFLDGLWTVHPAPIVLMLLLAALAGGYAVEKHDE